MTMKTILFLAALLFVSPPSLSTQQAAMTLEAQAAVIATQVAQLGPQARIQVTYIVPSNTVDPRDNSIQFSALALLFGAIEFKAPGARIVTYSGVRRPDGHVTTTILIQHP